MPQEHQVTASTENKHMSKTYHTYILTNKPHGSLYVGITSNLIKRIWQHKNNITKGFTHKYNIKLLVYFEEFNDPYSAIKREKRLKEWQRTWKIKLINDFNPEWKDLYPEIIA